MMILLIWTTHKKLFLLFDTDIPVPVVMGQSYKMSVLGASLVNGGSYSALSHEHLKDRVVTASKYLTLKKRIAMSTSENKSLY